MTDAVCSMGLKQILPLVLSLVLIFSFFPCTFLSTVIPYLSNFHFLSFISSTYSIVLYFALHIFHHLFPFHILNSIIPYFAFFLPPLMLALLIHVHFLHFACASLHSKKHLQHLFNLFLFATLFRSLCLICSFLLHSFFPFVEFVPFCYTPSLPLQVLIYTLHYFFFACFFCSFSFAFFSFSCSFFSFSMASLMALILLFINSLSLLLLIPIVC